MVAGATRRLERGEDYHSYKLIVDCPYFFCQVTDAVHEKGSFIYAQLWALGRTSDPKAARAENPALEYVAPSAIGLTGKEETPRPLTVDEIKEYVELYATAAANAVGKAGFDGAHFLM